MAVPVHQQQLGEAGREDDEGDDGQHRIQLLVCLGTQESFLYEDYSCSHSFLPACILPPGLPGSMAKIISLRTHIVSHSDDSSHSLMVTVAHLLAQAG